MRRGVIIEPLGLRPLMQPLAAGPRGPQCWRRSTAGQSWKDDGPLPDHTKIIVFFQRHNAALGYIRLCPEINHPIQRLEKNHAVSKGGIRVPDVRQMGRRRSRPETPGRYTVAANIDRDADAGILQAGASATRGVRQ